MMEFIHAAMNSSLVQNAILAGVLASIACGVVGSYVVVRRITYLAGGIAHSVLGGMGVAMYLRSVYGWDWLSPLHGAIVAALGAALIVGVVTMKYKQREDTIISAIWATGMAVGVLFMSRTPGYQQDLMSYLFGNILMVARGHLWLIVALDAVIVVVSLALYKHIQAVCFDEEFARTRGVATGRYYMLLLCLTALTVVLLVTVVGVVMVIALLALPAAIASQFARRLWSIMLLAVAVSMVTTIGGLAISFAPDLPSGATIIVLTAVGYVGALVYSTWRHRRMLRLRVSRPQEESPAREAGR